MDFLRGLALSFQPLHLTATLSVFIVGDAVHTLYGRARCLMGGGDQLELCISFSYIFFVFLFVVMTVVLQLVPGILYLLPALVILQSTNCMLLLVREELAARRLCTSVVNSHGDGSAVYDQYQMNAYLGWTCGFSLPLHLIGCLLLLSGYAPQLSFHQWLLSHTGFLLCRLGLSIGWFGLNEYQYRLDTYFPIYNTDDPRLSSITSRYVPFVTFLSSVAGIMLAYVLRSFRTEPIMVLNGVELYIFSIVSTICKIVFRVYPAVGSMQSQYHIEG